MWQTKVGSGRRCRTFTVIDIFMRKCLDVAVGQTLHAADWVVLLARRAEAHVPRQ